MVRNKDDEADDAWACADAARAAVTVRAASLLFCIVNLHALAKRAPQYERRTTDRDGTCILVRQLYKISQCRSSFIASSLIASSPMEPVFNVMRKVNLFPIRTYVQSTTHLLRSMTA